MIFLIAPSDKLLFDSSSLLSLVLVENDPVKQPVNELLLKYAYSSLGQNENEGIVPDKLL